MLGDTVIIVLQVNYSWGVDGQCIRLVFGLGVGVAAMSCSQPGCAVDCRRLKKAWIHVYLDSRLPQSGVMNKRHEQSLRKIDYALCIANTEQPLGHHIVC